MKEQKMYHKEIQKGNARIVFFGTEEFINGEDLELLADKLISDNHNCSEEQEREDEVCRLESLQGR